MSSESSGAATRAMAARCVDYVLADGMSLDSAFAAADLHTLDERAQSFVKALAYGAVRTHFRNAALLELLLDKPIKAKDSVIYALLSVGLFALQESRRPDYAVVSATVSAVDKLGRKRMRGFINAILRRFLRERDSLLAQLDQDEQARTLHPDWLVDRMQGDWPDAVENVLTANNSQAPMWLRVNQQKLSPDDYLQNLRAADIGATQPLAALPEALLLDEPQPVSNLPGFAAGECSVQDAASQRVAGFLAPQPGDRVLDACAAPGGKTCHLLESFPAIEQVIALDISADRLLRVDDNLNRLHLDALVMEGDALEPAGWWDGQPFDRILIDAPCSAIGVLRRHPDIRLLRMAADIPVLAAIQLRMLHALWPLLKTGGRLLYTTCSILRMENEAVIAAFLAEQSNACELPLSADMLPAAAVATAHGLQILPSATGSDGFYYALLEKN